MIKLSNRWYDFSKKLVQLGLPATATLYFALGSIWGFPAVDNVVASLAAIATFLGVILGVSHANYVKSDANFDGTLTVREDEEGNLKFMLAPFDDDPTETFMSKDVISFRVDKQSVDGSFIPSDGG